MFLFVLLVFAHVLNTCFVVLCGSTVAPDMLSWNGYWTQITQLKL